MRILPTAAALALASLAARPVPAQEAEPRDWRLPFRSPQANLVPPEEMYAHLRPMYAIAQRAPAAKRHLEDGGFEVVDDPDWRREFEAFRQVRYDWGYLSLVLRESRHAPDRAVAFYAATFCPDPQYGLLLVEHIPGEPVRSLREEAFQRAIPCLAAWLPERNEGDLAAWRELKVGPAGERPPKPGEYSHALDPLPFLAMLDLDDAIDRRQALWFLARCSELRPEFGVECLERTRHAFPTLLDSGDAALREAAIDFVATVAPPATGAVPRDADPEAVRAWFAAVDHALFPPIRRISEGLVELHAGDDRDQLVAVARAGLADGTLVERATGRRHGGGAWRGLRIRALPEPLDRLGFAVGDALTAIDGVPIDSAETLLRILDRRAKPGAVFLVEYVAGAGDDRAIEFRVR
ncbi:MAG: hypothetical protein IPM29_27650 [Planctomycetes bacterium]|nr:hypothetical protein [Planctomycetota bacterium]